MKKIINPTIVVNFKDIFGEHSYTNPLELIKDINKEEIISALCYCNYVLKPPMEVYFDYSIEKQLKTLYFFCGGNQSLFNFYRERISYYLSDKGTKGVLFNRTANLFGLEMVIESDFLKIKEDYKMNISDWDCLIKFYLLLNEQVYEKKYDSVEKGLTILEKFNSVIVSTNQYIIESNLIFSITRALKLFNFLNKDEFYSEELKKYFKTTYNCSSDLFLKQIISIISHKSTDDELIRFFYKVEDELSRKLFDALSYKGNDIKSNSLEFLSLKKYPFYKSKLGYLLLDNQFLIEKSYDLLINDFWFDWLSKYYVTPKERESALRKYKSSIGKFFENYLRNLLTTGFVRFKYPPPKFFEDLKITTIIGDIELADIYLRHNHKVFLAEAKSGILNSNQKYSKSSIEFYKNDPDKFYKDFGLNQVVSYIYNLKKYPKNFDNTFPVNKKIEIFPSIVYYEKAFKSGQFSETFNSKFKSMINESDFPDFIIHPLILIHIEDVEYVYKYLRDNKHMFFELLRRSYKQKIFPDPFHLTLADNNIPYNLPDGMEEIFIELSKAL